MKNQDYIIYIILMDILLDYFLFFILNYIGINLFYIYNFLLYVCFVLFNLIVYNLITL